MERAGDFFGESSDAFFSPLWMTALSQARAGMDKPDQFMDFLIPQPAPEYQ